MLDSYWCVNSNFHQSQNSARLTSNLTYAVLTSKTLQNLKYVKNENIDIIYYSMKKIY